MKGKAKSNDREIESKLSETLTELLDESARLLQLKADWGRMPNGPVKSNAVALIEKWFETAHDNAQGKSEPKDQVLISFAALQELWHAYTSHRDLIREGCHYRVIRRLEREGWNPQFSDDDEGPPY